MDAISQASIDNDFHCYKCEYNLRGLVAGDNCPECGTVIPPYYEQPLLSSYDPIWLARVGIGLWFIAASYAITTAFEFLALSKYLHFTFPDHVWNFIFFFVPNQLLSLVLFQLLESGLMVVKAIGVWMAASSPKPQIHDPKGRPLATANRSGLTSREYLRFFATFSVLGYLVIRWTHISNVIFSLPVLPLQVAMVFLAYHLVQLDLAVRSQQPKISKQAFIMKWVGAGNILVLLGISMFAQTAGAQNRIYISEAYQLLSFFINFCGAAIFAMVAQRYRPVKVRWGF